jgi:hypothetical protein
MSVSYNLKKQTFYTWYYQNRTKEQIAAFLSPYLMNIVNKDVAFNLQDLLDDVGAVPSYILENYSQRKINDALQGYNLSNTAKDIYVFTAAAHSTCITNIVNHGHFADKSLSTIKRAVLELKEKKLLIESDLTYIQDDKRVVWLTINGHSINA